MIGKKPQDMEPFIKMYHNSIHYTSFEDNWLDSVDQLRGMSDSQWSDLKIPMGLVNAMKKQLQNQ
jgi:hypothetical protein